MKFELRRLTSYSDQNLIEEIRRVADLVHPASLTRHRFIAHSKVHSSTIEKRFGSWRMALREADRESQMDSAANLDVSAEDIVVLLKDVAQNAGTTNLTLKQFSKNTGIGAGAIYSRFGTWKNALEAAGLEQSNRAARYTDEECFENLVEVWTLHGRAPYYREMNEPPSTIGPKAYMRFGSWKKALEAFVSHVSSTSSQSPPDTSIEGDPALVAKTASPTPPTPRAPEDRRDVRLGLRFEILNRDSFKCVLCGNSPANDPKCKLHVDHILPFSKGGKTKVENLRTLCDQCNLGRGNRFTE